VKEEPKLIHEHKTGGAVHMANEGVHTLAVMTVVMMPAMTIQ
jgi:hypothetical protein